MNILNTKNLKAVGVSGLMFFWQDKRVGEWEGFSVGLQAPPLNLPLGYAVDPTGQCFFFGHENVDFTAIKVKESLFFFQSMWLFWIVCTSYYKIKC